MPRLFSLVALLLALSIPFAPTHAAGEPESDSWLVALGAMLTDRYQVDGDLRLFWNRARPAAAPEDADLAILSAPSQLAPQLLVTVRATDAAGVGTDHTLILRAELWREGWMLRAPAATASPLDPANLEVRRFDGLRERDALVVDPTAELDFARNVPGGRLLVWRDVIRRPLVRRGQMIEVLATSGALTVTLRGVALADAARGDVLRVRNPDSKKDFVAVVISESRAAVHF